MEKKFSSIREEWAANAATLPYSEGPFPPSMTEPSTLIPLEQLVRDYSRGVVHLEGRQAFYDGVGDEITELHEPEDISELDLPESPFTVVPKLRKLVRAKPAPEAVPEPKPANDPDPKDAPEQ